MFDVKTITAGYKSIIDSFQHNDDFLFISGKKRTSSIQLVRIFSNNIKNDDDENDNEQKEAAIGGHLNAHKTFKETHTNFFSALASSSSKHPWGSLGEIFEAKCWRDYTMKCFIKLCA